ncbi:hypothetical protein SLEP1_g12927 [Rubroshorea leprosula]|uniref:Uncharacterized protein n=1 Tax=Rubroshorea leprosula TaxID=152421 RepID=A0AAV5IK08_9ROSI|nr:hypothetical protein SLEP1_g12927 [Rubroshorea leprosula]
MLLVAPEIYWLLATRNKYCVGFQFIPSFYSFRYFVGILLAFLLHQFHCILGFKWRIVDGDGWSITVST